MDIYKTCNMYGNVVRRRIEGYVPSRKDKYFFPRINMEEHFTMLRETKDFQCRFKNSRKLHNIVNYVKHIIDFHSFWTGTSIL